MSRFRQAVRKAFALRTWPQEVAPGWLAPLLFQPGADVTAVVQTRRLEPAEARRKLRQQRTVLTDVVQGHQRAGVITDYDTVADLASPTELARRLATEGETLYDTGIALLIRAANDTALATHLAALQTHAAAQEARWEPLDGQLRPDLASLTTEPIRYRRTLDQATLRASSPFLTTDLGTPRGPWWGIAQADQSPVFLDLWDTEAGWPAAHLVVVGMTGVGKTTFFTHLVCEHLTQPDPPDVVILDPVKGDYRRLAKAVGGVRIAFPTSSTVINALDLPSSVVLSGTGEATAQNPVRVQTRLCVGLVALMVCEEGERLRKAERAVVEAAILMAYAGKGITPERPVSWKRPAAEMPLLVDVLQALEALGVTDLATRLRPYCTGTLASLFSQPTNVPNLTRVVSFDLEGVDPDLLPLAVWLIGNYVWKLAKSDRKRRVLVLEEVGTLLERPESARLVAHLYALGRAYGLSVWSTTQLLSDYTATQEGTRALDNAHTLLLLRQSPGGSALAQARYGLSDQERVWLEGAATGEGWLSTPKGGGRLRIVPAREILALASPGRVV